MDESYINFSITHLLTRSSHVTAKNEFNSTCLLSWGFVEYDSIILKQKIENWRSTCTYPNDIMSMWLRTMGKKGWDVLKDKQKKEQKEYITLTDSLRWL